jgi:alpha-tubulin suppressor-like RCC1 family protein
MAGDALGPISVAFRKTDGTVDVSANGLVTLALRGSDEARLSGTQSMSAVSGVATFTDLAVNGSANGLTLIATASSARPDTSAAFIAAPVPGPGSFTSITVGNGHTCGLSPQGRAYCWGFNGFGELGDGTISTRDVPTRVKGNLIFSQIVAAGFHTCGITPDGVAYCWGDNQSGELGDGTKNPRLEPTAVIGGRQFLSIVTGDRHTCGLVGINPFCWGSDLNDQGANDGRADNTQPTQVKRNMTFEFVQVATGWQHSCGRQADGTVRCWGWNHYGQRGVGSLQQDDGAYPTAGNGMVFASVHAGDRFTCARTAAGVAWCWGYNVSGQLGDGTTAQRVSPVAVSGNIGFTQLAAGMAHACGISQSGPAFCWGSNELGQLGDGTSTDRLTPALVGGSVQFTQIAAGVNHSCGLAADGQAYCWGYNESGQLGDDSRTQRLLPVRVKSE